MGQHPGIRQRDASNSEERQLLVLGYHGTLQPDPRWVPAGSNAWATHPEPAASWMAEFLEPTLADALRCLESRLPASQRIFAGQPIPLKVLTTVLQQRLTGIFTQALAAHLEADDSLPPGDLIRPFPLLSRLLRHAAEEWASATAAFLARLHHDAPRFPAWLGVDTLPPIASLVATTADLHPGGHFGIRVAFHGGGCLYYKPRPVTGEWLWRRLLEVIAQADPGLRLPAARILPGGRSGRYGWAESVLPQEYVDPDQPTVVTAAHHDFWHAAGATLCLAQHARLTDLHLGNILATPFGPAVTDAECIASPQLTPHRPSGSGEAEASRALSDLLDTGLLPRKSPTGSPDASGLFGAAAPVPALTLPQWALDPTGKCRLQPAPAVLLDHGNAPASTTPVAVLPQLLAGYRHGAEVLQSVRSSLIDPGSSWRKVLETLHAPRTILRDTLSYAIMLSQSLESACLVSAHRRDAVLLDVLRTKAPDSFPPAIIRAELHALQHLHIPRFVIQPGARTLTTGAGRTLARNYCAAAPAASVLQGIEELCDHQLESAHIPALLLAILG